MELEEKESILRLALKNSPLPIGLNLLREANKPNPIPYAPLPEVFVNWIDRVAKEYALLNMMQEERISRTKAKVILALAPSHPFIEEITLNSEDAHFFCNGSSLLSWRIPSKPQVSNGRVNFIEVNWRTEEKAF
jgi:hypothetical protein